MVVQLRERLGQPLSPRPRYAAGMKLKNTPTISTDAEIIIVKFGKAIILKDGPKSSEIDGGDRSDRNTARIWINHIAQDSIPDTPAQAN